MAKLETYNKIVNCAFGDGIKDTYPNMTDKEAYATDVAADKIYSRLYKLLGIAKIHKKMDIAKQVNNS